MRGGRLLVFFGLCAFIGAAQNDLPSIGLEGGAGLTSLRGHEVFVNGRSPRMGYGGAMTLRLGLNQIFSVQTGLGFERKGSEVHLSMFSEDGSSFPQRIRHTLDYLILPVMGRVEWGDHVQVFAQAGPYAGYLLRYTLENQGHFNGRSDRTTLHMRLDLGISAGCGMAIPVRKSFALSCEIRNNLGLRELRSHRVSGAFGLKTNSTLILLGISYALQPR